MSAEPAAAPVPESTERVNERSTAQSNEVTLFWENLTFMVPSQETADLNKDGPKLTVKEHFCATEALTGHSAEKPMKTIVQNLTGVARPNEIVGLLGPSGCGKTVLMNIFSSRLHPPAGSVYKRNVYINNGVELSRDIFGKVGAYVMQDDVLLETLTPYECICFSANLRLSGTPEEKEKRVNEVIKDLKLEKCRNTLVGNVLKKGISGGERKRTSIGVEIVTDPSLIILDGTELSYIFFTGVFAILGAHATRK